MKKIFFGLLILLTITGLVVFVSCDSTTVLSSDKFVGTWIQNSLETKIIITEPGIFTVTSFDEDFAGLTGTYVPTIKGATISIDGIEEEYSLILLEKDVLKLELPKDMGGDAFFVKQRDVDLNLTGTWKNADNSITAKLNDVNDTLVVTIGIGSDTIVISGNFQHEDNMFIMFIEEDYDNSEFLQEIGSGVVSASGKAYTFCMDVQGDWSSTILSKLKD